MFTSVGSAVNPKLGSQCLPRRHVWVYAWSALHANTISPRYHLKVCRYHLFHGPEPDDATQCHNVTMCLKGRVDPIKHPDNWQFPYIVPQYSAVAQRRSTVVVPQALRTVLGRGLQETQEKKNKIWAHSQKNNSVIVDAHSCMLTQQASSSSSCIYHMCCSKNPINAERLQGPRAENNAERLQGPRVEKHVDRKSEKTWAEFTACGNRTCFSDSSCLEL